MIKVVREYTKKYIDMIRAFNSDNFLKVGEIISINKEITCNSYFDIEKELIKNKDERLMKDIELLEELEYYLSHNKLKIVEVDKEKLNIHEVL